MMNRKQSGMTMIGFVITLGVVMFFLYCGMKVVPMYTEFYSVKKALSGLAAEPGISAKSKEQVRDLFFRRMNISYVENVKEENIKIERRDTGWLMIVDYELRKPFIANLDVVGKFHAEQALTRGQAPE